MKTKILESNLKKPREENKRDEIAPPALVKRVSIFKPDTNVE